LVKKEEKGRRGCFFLKEFGLFSVKPIKKRRRNGNTVKLIKNY